jgi:hypothetical protein
MEHSVNIKEQKVIFTKTMDLVSIKIFLSILGIGLGIVTLIYPVNIEEMFNLLIMGVATFASGLLVQSPKWIYSCHFKNKTLRIKRPFCEVKTSELKNNSIRFHKGLQVGAQGRSFSFSHSKAFYLLNADVDELLYLPNRNEDVNHILKVFQSNKYPITQKTK